MKIYISTPMKGIDPKTISRRIKTAEEEIRKRGHESVSPVDICPENLSYGQCMGRDIEFLIDHCEGILFTEDYRFSQGCMIELYVAGVTGKTMYYDPEEIPAVH